MIEKDNRGMQRHPFGTGNSYLSGVSEKGIQAGKDAHERFCLVIGIKGDWETLADREKLAWVSAVEIHQKEAANHRYNAETWQRSVKDHYETSTKYRDTIADSLGIKSEHRDYFDQDELLLAFRLNQSYQTEEDAGAYIANIIKEREAERIAAEHDEMDED